MEQQNEYAIQILNIDLYRWQDVYNMAYREMCIEAQEYWGTIMEDADRRITNLRQAILILNQE